MKSLFDEAIAITNMDGNNVAFHLAKAVEEFGELGQEINKTLGIKNKKNGETDDVIKENVLEEGTDLIQCVISIFADYGITYKDFVYRLEDKNKVWLDKYIKK